MRISKIAQTFWFAGVTKLKGGLPSAEKPSPTLYHRLVAGGTPRPQPRIWLTGSPGYSLF
ncbi:hypothetical protein PL9214520363 [Planktothrix tepida PCC 9214]|uniref:Uncharacterized protein n=1 Tax=Planktothrix tepida PCC 9214 TaxID=671072 RepID=A0A1J1LMQ7_9CYAN|nr:hypothetical protein PL9214520363 [Planktothrix tepida PCC 9214]